MRHEPAGIVRPVAISLCVCTYNRADMLAATLPALAALDLDPARVTLELLLVDNNSSDGTRAAVEAHGALFPYPVRYLFEARQGLSHARNAAVEAASGEYLGFLDDECVVPRHWAVRAAGAIAASGAAIIGGPYFAGFLDGPRPRWFEARYGDAYFLARGAVSGFAPGFRASGGNMLLRRDVFEALRFDPALGMTGGRVAVGEETALQEAWLDRHPGSAVWYEPDLAVTHLVRPEKMSILYKLKREYAQGVAAGLRFAARGRDKPIDREAVRRDLVELLLSPWRAVRRDRRRHPYWQNFYYEEVLPGPLRRLARVRQIARARRAARRPAP